MKYIIIGLAFVFTVSAIANQSMKKEIDYLLMKIEQSSCQFIRNGTFHPPKKAISHIKRKFNHYKDDIKTAEEFIELSATKSSMSGKPYFIKCPDQQKISSKDWLIKRLKIFRENNFDKTKY